jgi:hypothetical protein
VGTRAQTRYKIWVINMVSISLILAIICIIFYTMSAVISWVTYLASKEPGYLMAGLGWTVAVLCQIQLIMYFFG